MKQPNDRIHCKSRNQASSEEVTAVQQLLTNILCTTPLSVFNGSYTDPKFIRAYWFQRTVYSHRIYDAQML